MVDAVADVVDATVEAAQMNVNAKEIAANNNKETKILVSYFFTLQQLYLLEK
jgi:hypothetical protein